MNAQFIAAAENWLSGHTTLDTRQRNRLAALVPVLLGPVAEQQARFIGISGAPGTGKTTLAGACAAALEDAGRKALVISLDNYYLPKTQRKQLARAVHPLLERRGVPGTHDIDLLKRHLEALRTPGHDEIRLPVFDKSDDDRSATESYIPPGFIPSCVFIEGWMAGAPPQQVTQLSPAIDAFESSHDPQARWRQYVNTALQKYSGIFAAVLDERWFLKAPDWQTVIDWRWQQEQENPRRWLHSRDQVVDFLQSYRRICAHMDDSNKQWVDHTIELDTRHMPRLVN